MPDQPAVDLMAVLADMQRQINELNTAVTSQQATIDLLVDAVLDLPKELGDARE